MRNSYEKVFGISNSNDYPIAVSSILNRILNHTLNKFDMNKMLDLSWGDYVTIKEHTGIDLRLVLTKKSDVESFYGDNAERYIRLSYKSYEIHLYFDEQIRSRKAFKRKQNRFKTALPENPVFDEILSTSQDILKIPSLSLSDLVFVDTETTGLFNADHVIELGIVDSNEVVLFDSLLKPRRKRKIHPMAIKAHGITDSKLIDKPRLIDVQNDVMKYLERKYIVFYNARFDVGKMLKSSDGHIFDGCAGVICLMKVYKDYHKNSKNASLIKACEHYGIRYNDVPNHRAIGDAIKTARLCSVLFQDMVHGRNHINNTSVER